MIPAATGASVSQARLSSLELTSGDSDEVCEANDRRHQRPTCRELLLHIDAENEALHSAEAKDAEYSHLFARLHVKS